MIGSEVSELQATTSSPGIAGRRFYQPGAIATYCALSLPVGICLYGLNVARRGSPVMGYTLSGVSLAVFLGMLTTATAGVPSRSIGSLGVFVAIGLLNLEWDPYQYAISRGGLRARWWPPLLWAIGLGLFVGILVPLLGVN